MQKPDHYLVALVKDDVLVQLVGHVNNLGAFVRVDGHFTDVAPDVDTDDADVILIDPAAVGNLIRLYDSGKAMSLSDVEAYEASPEYWALVFPDSV